MFPEPTDEDATFARRGEGHFRWLLRSTLPRAVEARRFLNEHLSAIPHPARHVLYEALGSRWQSAFFELIVARMLQQLGASVELEVETVTGRRPDFLACFDDGRVIVEATTPVINGETEEEARRRQPLLDLIEDRTPSGWRIGVWGLPDLGLSDSRKEFKRIVDRLLSIPPPLPGQAELDLIEDTPIGAIHLHLRPKVGSSRSLLLEPVFTAFDQTEARITKALAAKKRQVRGTGVPVLLAVNAAGIGSGFDDFDRAIYGHTSNYGFIEDGAFTTHRSEPPTYAGLIAFVEVGFRLRVSPRLYLHPRSTAKLPGGFAILEHSVYEPDRQIITIRPARTLGWWIGLNPVPSHI